MSPCTWPRRRARLTPLYEPELDRHDAAGLTLLSELPRAIRETASSSCTTSRSSTSSRASWPASRRSCAGSIPTRGLIAPGDFVPAAEKTGLIEPLTRYVLDEALGQLARWSSDGHGFKVAVNLSMRNLHDPELPEQVARLLRKWAPAGRPPDRRDHRERDRLGSRQDGGRDPRAQGARRRHRDRRLRHGLHLARLPRPARDHAAQDRSLVRAEHGRRRRRRRDRALDHHARARPRARGRGRGRRDEGHVRPARRSRLRPRPGLLAEPAAAAGRADASGSPARARCAARPRPDRQVSSASQFGASSPIQAP